MTKPHNKRRNVGLMYEMLLREASISVIENDNERAKTVVDIIKKHFAKGSQLQKEYKLFNALIQTSAPTESVAIRILDEAKKFSASIDQKKLHQEKTSLIHSINYLLTKSIYERKIPNYRIYATVQTLLNDWRLLSEADLSRLIDYEGKVLTWILKEKRDATLADFEVESTDKLVVKIMTDKLNEKYSKDLSEEQRELINHYVFYMGEDRITEMTKYLEDLKSSTITSVEEYLLNESNAYLNSKASKVLEDIEKIDTSTINDELIGKMLVISNLKHTIVEK